MTEVGRVPVAGAVCFAAGLFGAAGSGYLAATTTIGGRDAFFYPHPVAEVTGLQMALAFAPAILIGGLVALRWTGALPCTRRARLGYYSAIVTLAGFTSVGGMAVTVPESALAAGPTAFGVVYACYSMLLGACLLMAGLEVARGGPWVGWHRWLPFSLGCWLVIAVFPALAAGPAEAGWAMAGWFGLFAMFGLVLVRDTHPHASQLNGRPRTAVTARAAAVVTWIYVAAFGGPAIPVTAYLLQNQTLPAFLDVFNMYGGPLWGQVSLAAFAVAIAAFSW